MEPTRRLQARPGIGVVLLVLLVCAASATAPAQTGAGSSRSQTEKKLARWVGTYKFSERGPSPAAFEYLVDICDASGRTYVSVVGQMTELRILARARAHRRRVNIYFDGYEAPDSKKSRYQPGDLLLTLQRRRNQFRLRWGILRPEENNNHKLVSAEKLPVACGPGPPAG